METKQNQLQPHPFKDILTTRFKARIVKELLKGENGSVLDIGCGSGFILSQIEDQFASAQGIDMSPEAIQFGGQFTRAKLQVANAEALPFAANTFDCVVATDAFEHIPDDKQAAREVARTLKPGGKFLVYVPSNVGVLSKTKAVEMYHTSDKSYLLDQRYYTKETLRELVEQAGLKVDRCEYHNVFAQEFWTQALKMAAKAMGKEYEHQADIKNFTQSKVFPVYRYALLPVISGLVRGEEFLCENFFGGAIPGHRIVMLCHKPNESLQ